MWKSDSLILVALWDFFSCFLFLYKLKGAVHPLIWKCVPGKEEMRRASVLLLNILTSNSSLVWIEFILGYEKTNLFLFLIWGEHCLGYFVDLVSVSPMKSTFYFSQQMQLMPQDNLILYMLSCSWNYIQPFCLQCMIFVADDYLKPRD